MVIGMVKDVLFDKKPTKTLFSCGFLGLKKAKKNKQFQRKNKHQNKQLNSFYFANITSYPYISLTETIFTLFIILKETKKNHFLTAPN